MGPLARYINDLGGASAVFSDEWGVDHDMNGLITTCEIEALLDDMCESSDTDSFEFWEGPDGYC